MQIPEIPSFDNLTPEPISSNGPLPMDREAFCEIDATPFKVKALTRFITESPSLIVFLPAAFTGDREKWRYPNLTRWTWGRKLPVSSITIDDPTIYFGELAGGWFQGTQDCFAIDAVASAIQGICSRLNVPLSNVVFYGSSLGGFAALMMAPVFPNSFAFAEIPQTELSTYPAIGHIRTLCKIVYGTDDISHIRNKYPDRFSVLERFRTLRTVPRFRLLHELTDEPNGATQVYPFVPQVLKLAAELDIPSNEIQIDIRNNGRGHAARNLDETGPIVVAELKRHREFRT